MADVTPTELGELLRNVFYKHIAPLALQNLGIRQQYQSSPLFFLETESGEDRRTSYASRSRSRSSLFLIRQPAMRALLL
jgi:tricorn protease-like protein